MPDAANLPEIDLVRHGETAWSLSGQHTGTTDIPLTEDGEAQARLLGKRLSGIAFDRVWSSPRTRAIRTAELAGLGGQIEVVEDLAEWDYGAYEGLTSEEIHAQRPDWLIYRDGCPNGDSVAALTERVDRLVARLRALDGRTVIFTHGHLTRVLGVRWVGLPTLAGQLLQVGTAALGTLSFSESRDHPVITLWNDRRHTEG